MTIGPRKSRPLRRDGGALRDDRLFIVACDDTYAPKQYFSFFPIPRVQVHVVPTENGESAIQRVLDRLLEIEHEEDDERWVLVDTDHYIQGTHLPSFLAALKQARDNNVKVALSRPCFELWLLLHHVDEEAVDGLQSAAEVTEMLRTVLGGYNKTRLRSEDFNWINLKQALERASRLDAKVIGDDIPQKNTTRVYLLWLAIVRACPAQLPEHIRQLGIEES